MPRPTPGLALILVVTLAGCPASSPQDGGAPDDASVDAGPHEVTLAGERSEQCADIEGGLAVYWDWMRGVFHELPEQPLPGPDWVLYQHPDSPLLGFYHPPDYTGFDFRGPQTVGVDLVRDDGRVVWTYLQTWGDASTTAQEYVALHIDRLREQVGTEAPFEARCADDPVGYPAQGIVVSGAARAGHAGDFALVVTQSVTLVEGLEGGSLFFGNGIGPRDEYDELVLDVFLPIHFQLFVNGGSVQDTDGDGVADDDDAFPYDPERS